MQKTTYQVSELPQNERIVLQYLSDNEMEKLKKKSLGKRMRYLREKMNVIFPGEYSLHKMAKRIKKRLGLSTTAAGLWQIEEDRVKSPRAVLLLGIASEFGVSMEFLLLGPKENESEMDIRLKAALKDPSVKKIALRASQHLTDEGKQVILNMLEKAKELVRNEVTP
jgi:transcriptional regulator with XRE-family HTH domain